MSMPEFKMPACIQHFFKGYRWRCKRCRAEAEDQFRGCWYKDDR